MSIEDQIIEGNCVEIMKSLPDGIVDLVVTDPPYLCSYRDRTGRTLANDDNPEAVLSAYEEIFRVLKPDSYCVTFYGWTEIAGFSRAWKEAGFSTVGHIVWAKDYASKSSHTRYQHESAFLLAKGFPEKPDDPISDVQPWEYTGNKAHPTEKAVSIIEPLIRSFSREGDLVLDPFAGSGSTCVAAALAGRRYLGIDLEARYCELARKRLAGAARYLSYADAA